VTTKKPKGLWKTRHYAVAVGMPSRLDLPADPALGIMRSLAGSGRNVRAFRLLPREVQESVHIIGSGDESRDDPVHSRRAGALVPAHPLPGDRQEVGVIDEVEQIIEPAAGIFGRPQVQLGLHPPYPCLRPYRGEPRLASIHQRLRPLQHVACVNPLDPFAMRTAFPVPGLLRVLRPAPCH
jgi:hypothetical protein